MLLYVPLGLLWPWMSRAPGWSGAAFGLLISLPLEILQATTRNRTASLLDVLANGLGHAFGYALAFWLMQHRGLSHSVFVGGRGGHSLAGLAGVLRAAYVTALLALSFLPYDVTVSAGRIWSKALGDGSEPGRIHLFLSAPWDRSRVASAVLTLCLLAVFGALSWLAAHGSAPPTAAKLALQGLLVAGSIEAGQVVVASRTADVAQVLLGPVGAIRRRVVRPAVDEDGRRGRPGHAPADRADGPALRRRAVDAWPCGRTPGSPSSFSPPGKTPRESSSTRPTGSPCRPTLRDARSPTGRTSAGRWASSFPWACCSAPGRIAASRPGPGAGAGWPPPWPSPCSASPSS